MTARRAMGLGSGRKRDHCSALRHAGRIILDFGRPLFDLFYLSDFQGRLSLADATMSLAASGPLGSITLRAFVSHAEGVLCGEVECTFPEVSSVEITIERYGSRTFGHWYQQINRDPNIGLLGTQAEASADYACITHTLTSGTFALGCRVTHNDAAPVTYTREHSHCCKVRIPGASEQRFAFTAVVTPPGPDDAFRTGHRVAGSLREAAGSQALRGSRRGVESLLVTFIDGFRARLPG